MPLFAATNYRLTNHYTSLAFLSGRNVQFSHIDPGLSTDHRVLNRGATPRDIAMT